MKLNAVDRKIQHLGELELVKGDACDYVDVQTFECKYLHMTLL
jgi:hypothetical protein